MKEINRKFGVLISTMNKSENEIKRMRERENLLNLNILVINQVGYNSSYIIDHKCTVYNTDELGLSKSRNYGLKNSDFQISLIGDDDLIYIDNLEKIVCDTFELNPEYDIICFNTDKKKTFLKNHKTKINKLKLTSISSVQIAYKTKKIKDLGILFDERFGTGSMMFNSGEENIFINDCLEKGISILYVPIRILTIPDSESSWFVGFDENYFYSKGALVYKLYKPYSDIFFFLFIMLKTSNRKNKNITYSKAMYLMKKGKKDLMKEEEINK